MSGKNRPPLIDGIVLVAGGAVGAGMFALPVVSAGAGFVWAMLGLIAIWVLTYRASLVLLAVNLKFRKGASFNTLVTGTLGPRWAVVNNLAVAFIMYILMYAYVTAGGSIIDYTLSSYFDSELIPRRSFLSGLFALLIAVIVWLGTRIVSRASGFLVLAMGFMFVAAVASMLGPMDRINLMDTSSSYHVYLWGALPVFVAAFASAGLVPSLVKYYDREPHKIKQCLFYGTLLSLLIYAVWLATTMGMLSRTQLASVASAGGNMGDLLTSLHESGANASVVSVLTVFSHLAITTSFLSIGLGLFHFIADSFGFNDDMQGSLKSALITFLPPAMMSFLLPYGFITAIGFAGLAVVFSFFIIPVLMRYRQQSPSKSLAGEKRWLTFIYAFAALIAVLKILTILELLPSYR